MTKKRCPHCGALLDPEDDLFAEIAKSDRERIQDVLYDILRDGVPPPAPKQQRAFEGAVDTLVMEFREIHSKDALNHNLTSKIIAAIRQAYEEKGNAYPFKGNRSPNTPIIDCIVDAGIEDKGKAAARATDLGYAERSQAALAARQALRQVEAEVETEDEQWWGVILGELQLQMTVPTFTAWLEGTKLLEREGERIVIGVPTAYAQDWLENRLLSIIKRTVAADGITSVRFEVM